MSNTANELNSLEAQLLSAFRTGFLKASWDANTSGNDALAQSETGQAIKRLRELALECVEPVTHRIEELAKQLEAAYFEGFSLGKSGQDYEGSWVVSASRKSLYLEPKNGLSGLAPGNIPLVGERWYVLRDGASACQTVDVLDVTQFTALVRPVGALREERLALDMTRFIEKPLGQKEITPPSELLALYAKKIDFMNIHQVLSEARRLLGTMDDTMLKCLMYVLTEKVAAVYGEKRDSAKSSKPN